jgi:hypothetical protein
MLAVALLSSRPNFQFLLLNCTEAVPSRQELALHFRGGGQVAEKDCRNRSLCRFVGKHFDSDCRHCSHLQISVRFVLASGASLKGESDANSHTIALISAGV